MKVFRGSKGNQIIDVICRVLRESDRPLTVPEISNRIKSYGCRSLQTKTPSNTVFSIIWRANKKARENGESELFVRVVDEGKVLFTVK